MRCISEIKGLPKLSFKILWIKSKKLVISSKQIEACSALFPAAERIKKEIKKMMKKSQQNFSMKMDVRSFFYVAFDEEDENSVEEQEAGKKGNLNELNQKGAPKQTTKLNQVRPKSGYSEKTLQPDPSKKNLMEDKQESPFAFDPRPMDNDKNTINQNQMKPDEDMDMNIDEEKDMPKYLD